MSLLLFCGAGPVRAADILIPFGATWSYLDNGTDAGTAWRQTNFNDSAWATGPTQLGYGDGDEQKVINGGPSGNRYATTYFRNTFVVTNRASVSNVALLLMRDDGGIVYLNGVEVFRSNMPEEPATYTTWAALSVAASEESALFPAAIPPELLLSGTNVMAVEIHQSDPGSSDLSFSFELLANTPLGNLPPTATLSLGPSSPILAAGEPFTLNVAASDPETTVTRIDVFQDGASIQSIFASAGQFVWSNTVPGIHEFTSRAMDSAGVTGASTPLRLLVTSPGFQAHSVFFPQFPTASGLMVQNNAAISSNVLHLTRASVGSRGGVWMATPQGVRDGFATEFRFRIICKGGGGADGFCFVIAGTSQPLIGTGLGYTGVTNSLAVEFDTWLNASANDANDHHIGVHSRGPLANTADESASLGTYTPPTDFSDGFVHNVRIDYVPGTLHVFLDNLVAPVLTVAVDLGTLLSLPNGNAWIGLAAGSGASFENHDISAWSYTSYGSIPATVNLTSPAQAIRVAPGSDLTLSATVTTPNGQATAVDFLDGTALIGEVTNTPFSLVWSNLAAGIHLISARTTNGGGLQSSSRQVVVDVVAADAALFLFPDFSDTGSLILEGSAAVVTNRVRLTPAMPSQVGGAWFYDKLPVDYGFETVFQFQISELSSSGADGFAFEIFNSDYPALGDAGVGLGYGSITNSLAVEFDTYQNPEATDPDGNHVGVHTRGTAQNSADESASLGRVAPSVNMSDGAIHTVVIRYSQGLLRIFLDDLNTPLMKVPVDLRTLLSLDEGMAGVGFTSATGGEYENHDILMWSFQPNPRLQVQLVPLAGSIGLEFATVSGQSYTVQYSSDLLHWTNAVPSLAATGAVLTWQDSGPPGTDTPPGTQPQRFYRVLVSP